jgi:hypothetical protein
MAEAVKPASLLNSAKSSKKEQTNPSLNDENENPDNHLASTTSTTKNVINDQNLEKRLKSLTSFVNNLEPSRNDTIFPKEPNSVVTSSAPPLNASQKEETTSNYYDMISQQAQVNAKADFSQLTTQLNDIKIRAPPHPGLLHQNHQSNQMNMHLKETTTVVDFNLEKIKQLNQFNYPRLAWNKAANHKSHSVDEHATESSESEFESITEMILKKNRQIDAELMRFFDMDQLCKDLECYYKNREMQSENFDSTLNNFIHSHSLINEFQFDSSQTTWTNRSHEFYELCKDYFEARQLVGKCIRYMLEFKWKFIANQMRHIWTFEKYTIESSGMCGDAQQCKHELTSEKAYLNKHEMSKLATMLYERRFNLVKSGLISSQFCSKLAKVKIESYLHAFLLKFKSKTELISNQSAQNNDIDQIVSVNNELKTLIDILIYFNRKQCKPSAKLFQRDEPNQSTENNIYCEIDVPTNSTATTKKDKLNINESQVDSQPDEETNNIDDGEDSEHNDDLFKSNIEEWFKSLSCLLLNQSEAYRSDLLAKLMTSADQQQQQQQQLFFSFSSLHFDNIFFLLQHLLRSPQTYPSKFSYLLQVPLIFSKANATTQLFSNLQMNSSQSDSLANLYFDFYLKVLASFSYDIKYRKQFLFFNTNKLNTAQQQQKENNFEMVDLEGDLESVESVLVEISEDDLIQLYYQIPFSSIYSFLWHCLKSQSEFRIGYVAMRCLSFLDALARLSIRTLLIYNRLKYKNFCKLVGKTLKEAIKFAFLLKDEKALIQLHFDHFVKRIFTTIIYSSRVKSIRWIILSQLNIGELCLRTKWMILSIMCGIDVFHQNFEHLFNDSISTNNSVHKKTKAKDYIIQAAQNDLEALLASYQEELTHIELLSFMRTLHFLIVNSITQSSDSDSDTDPDSTADSYSFMQCVVKVLFKIAYCYASTRDICHKEGNCLLFAVCSQYPALMSTLLIDEIDPNLHLISKRALFLTADLPFDLWLVSIDCERDLVFLEKCFLFSPTNSILFRIAVNCVDQINFNQDTSAISKTYIQSWVRENNNCNNPRFANLSDRLSAATNNIYDLALIVKIKLTIILFELHTRLTIYTHFGKEQTTTTSHQELFASDLTHETISSPIMKLNVTSKDELSIHYGKLAKDKRLACVSWIWSTLLRLNLFVSIDQAQIVDYLEDLSLIYSSGAATATATNMPNNIGNSKMSHAKSGYFSNQQRYLQTFYKTYLCHQYDLYHHQLVEMSLIYQ